METKNKKKLGQVSLIFSLVFSLVFSICVGAFALETTPYSQIHNDSTSVQIAYSLLHHEDFYDTEELRAIYEQSKNRPAPEPRSERYGDGKAPDPEAPKSSERYGDGKAPAPKAPKAPKSMGYDEAP